MRITIDGYASSTDTLIYSISLANSDNHVLDIRNRSERNLLSNGYRVRFQSLMISGSDEGYDWQTLQYTYDALSRLTNANIYLETDTTADPIRQYSYNYDLAGNRLQQAVTVGSGSPMTTNYTYDNANQLATSRVNLGLTTGYTFDAAGRMTSDGTYSLNWDRANRLLSYNGSAYAYDGLGRRIQQTVGATVTQYLLDINAGLAKVWASTVGANTTHYVHGPIGLQQQQDSAGNWHWPVKDALGSVRGMVDGTIAPQESRQYSPYGEVYGATGTSQTAFGFTGEQTDPNNLVFLRARYMQPGTGIFLSQDPVEGRLSWPMSRNGYSYVEGNPVRWADPSGRDSDELFSPQLDPIRNVIRSNLAALPSLQDVGGALNGMWDLYHNEMGQSLPDAAASIFNAVSVNGGNLGSVNRKCIDWTSVQNAFHDGRYAVRAAEISVAVISSIIPIMDIAAAPLELSLSYQIFIRESLNIGDAIPQAFGSASDPLADILGPGLETHPDEIKAMLQHMREWDVDIRYQDTGRMTYTPAMHGYPGELVISPYSSIGAWRHEYQHFLDDLAREFPGARVLFQPDVAYEFEFNAYMREIDLAREIGRSGNPEGFNAARQLLQMLRDDRMKYLGY